MSSTVILDGSMGRYTLDMGLPEAGALWSAIGLVDPGSHGKVVLAHKHYIEAGARVVTTNNFGCNPIYFGKACAQQGWDPNDTTKHIVKYTKVAGDLARQAIKECGVPGVKLLGSLPCIWESHRPDQTDDFFREKGEEYIEDLYRQIAKALGEVDAFLCETMNTEQEAACAVRACRDLGKPIWVSFEPTFRGERLAPRCELAESAARSVVALAKGGANIEYLGFNCTTPEYITQALEALSPVVRKQLAVLGITLGVSPNFNDIEVKHRAGFDISKIKKTGGGSAGAGVHKVVKREDMVGGKWVNFAAKWHQLGVTCIGACCGSVPDDIKAMAEHVAKVPVAKEEAHLSQGAGCEGGGGPEEAGSEGEEPAAKKKVAPAKRTIRKRRA